MQHIVCRYCIIRHLRKPETQYNFQNASYWTLPWARSIQPTVLNPNKYSVIKIYGLRQPICSNSWFQRQMLFLVGGWMLKRRRNARCTAVADSVLMNSRKQKNLVLHSSHFALNWRCCTCCALGERSSGGIWTFGTSSFKCYVDHSHTMYSSGNIEVLNWVHLF